MPPTIFARPVLPTEATTVPASGAWAHSVDVLTSVPALIAYGAAAGLLTAYATTLIRNKRTNTDPGKKLMYVPLVLVNSAAIYGQVAYAYEHIAPTVWTTPAKVALALMFAAAIESIAVYVGWHAHDALLQKATATAARLRRASYLLALLVGGINYAHFAGDGLTPTAASVAFGLLSLLSPWLWGLHTRRAQHVRLTREGAVDATGATFSGERIRAFPIRSYMARRWSIDNYVTDPRRAWEGYNADLRSRRTNDLGTRVRAAFMVLRGDAVVVPGIAPGHRSVNGQGNGPGNRPGLQSSNRPAIDAGTTRSDDPDTTTGHDTDIDLAITSDTRTGGRTGTRRSPAPTRMPTQKRAENPGIARTRKPTSAQVKAHKLRAENPGITWAQLAAKVGVNERTVRRWFEAARPADDAPEERAQRPAAMTTFALPKPPVTAVMNGHPFPAQEVS